MPPKLPATAPASTAKPPAKPTYYDDDDYDEDDYDEDYINHFYH